MKPDEEMHAAVEEVDLDPCDLYIVLGTQIVEGRVPGLTERGYGEGPHCSPPQGQNRHQCDPNSSECEKYENIQKHMLLLWKNGIPMSIEVLLYPDCCASLTGVQTVDTSSLPEMSYILLEQWTIHMLPRRVPDASINPRGLLQAVRSYLHFSQLCAWLSLTGGRSPQNIHYRICVPGEAFSCKFSSQPDVHVFPVANAGRSNAMKVTVKAHPRCGQIPVVVCERHLNPSQGVKVMKQLPHKGHKLDILPEETISSDVGSDEEYCDGIPPVKVVPQKSRTNSPADTMLGDSLLDPPHSLQMYPKRYQSPSRCGSPSLEVPEHLMFGKGANVKREAARQRLQQMTRERSRPQRRPVVERFLKKTLGKDICASCSHDSQSEPVDTRYSTLNEMQKNILKDVGKVQQEGVVNYLSTSNDLPLPREEMECVLNRLRQRCSVGKHTSEQIVSPFSKKDKNQLLCVDISKMPGSSKSIQVSESLLNSNSHSPKQRTYGKSGSCLLEECEPNKKYSSTSTQHSPDWYHSEQKHEERTSENINYKKCRTYPLMHDAMPYAQFPKNKLPNRTSDIFLGASCKQDDSNYSLQKSEAVQRGQTSQELHMGQTSPNAPVHINEESLFPSTNVKNQNNVNDVHSSFDVIGCANGEYLQSASNAHIPKEQPLKEYQNGHTTLTQDIGKTLSHSKTWTEGLCTLRMQASLCSNSPFSHQGLTSPTSLLQEVNLTCHGHQVPSAEEKAQFRRSFDSATSLVFHKKTGLPLTSSPAPIRKSGTCFDFDSSLTTVSAIKRALFEKDPEEEDHDRSCQLSTSAPASITITSLLGSFEESVLNGRLEPVSTVEGFTAEIGASGSFCPRHIILPVTVFFYTLEETDKVTSPYLGHINLGKKGYHVPKKGTVQVTLFNPHQTVVKMFVVRYDLSDMPINCQTFLRQRTLYMPTDASEDDPEARKWLRYLIHLRFASTKSGRIYLHTDIRIIIFRKSDLDAATVHGQRPYELRSFTQGPSNPKFSPHK